MRTKSFVLLILFIIAVYVFQNEAVIPFVIKVVNSDLFTKETEDVAQLDPINTDKTRMALLHCNHYLKQNYEVDSSTLLSQGDHKAWTLGDKTFLVQSHIDFVDTASNQTIRKLFVCKIHQVGEDETNYENWEILAFDYENASQPSL